MPIPAVQLFHEALPTLSFMATDGNPTSTTVVSVSFSIGSSGAFIVSSRHPVEEFHATNMSIEVHLDGTVVETIPLGQLLSPGDFGFGVITTGSLLPGNHSLSLVYVFTLPLGQNPTAQAHFDAGFMGLVVIAGASSN